MDENRVNLSRFPIRFFFSEEESRANSLLFSEFGAA